MFIWFPVTEMTDNEKCSIYLQMFKNKVTVGSI